MVLSQVIAVFQAVLDAIGLPGNLLVIVTIVLERRFHVIRYRLLASLAVSDLLFLILVNSFRIASTAQERWLYGETMCCLNPIFTRYFYTNTVVRLIAVSYDRYSAIVKSPLTYDGMITKSRVLAINFIWVIPIPFAIGPIHALVSASTFTTQRCFSVKTKFGQYRAASRQGGQRSSSSLVLLHHFWLSFSQTGRFTRQLNCRQTW